MSVLNRPDFLLLLSLCLMPLSNSLFNADSSSALPRKLPAAPAGSFSIVVVPDTQAYHGRGTKADPKSKAPLTNQVFKNHIRWISQNLEKQKIVFVSHVGDIVDKNVPEQWAFARQLMDRLHGRVPYGISLGNHDMTSLGDSRLFQQVFPASRFREFDWYGGTFSSARPEPTISGNNANSYQLFSAGGLDFVFLHLECNAPDDVLVWANAILARHADRRAMITAHMDLGPIQKPKEMEGYFTAPKGRMQWKKMHGERGNTPQQMWEKCFQKHKNLFLICCGDQSRSQAMRLTAAGQAGNTVQELLCDYGTNWLRIYRFHPAENRVEAWTFEPETEKLCLGTKIVPETHQHQFQFFYEMS